jgi:hypothetical protein
MRGGTRHQLVWNTREFPETWSLKIGHAIPLC